MNVEEKIITARRQLHDLRKILESEHEDNWIRGVDAALMSLNKTNPSVAFAEARSIYTTMIGGRGPFSEYYIVRTSEAEQSAANKELDALRDSLWDLFENK